MATLARMCYDVQGGKATLYLILPQLLVGKLQASFSAAALPAGIRRVRLLWMDLQLLLQLYGCMLAGLPCIMLLS